jgi:hypothetical protein
MKRRIGPAFTIAPYITLEKELLHQEVLQQQLPLS